MNTGYIFSLLEIEPTTDTREIKKAYAKLVKKYHPEEQPEKWKEIHEAYEAALVWAKGGRREAIVLSAPAVKTEKTKSPSEPPGESVPQPMVRTEKTESPSEPPRESVPQPMVKAEKTKESLETSEQNMPRQDELDALFDHIGQLSSEQRKLEREAFDHELQKVLHAFREISGRKKLNRKEWEDFFSQDARMPYICTKEFLEMLGDCFADRKADAQMYTFLTEQLEMIRAYNTGRNGILPSVFGIEPVRYAEIKIAGAYDRWKAGTLQGRLPVFYQAFKKIAIIFLIIAGIIIRLNVHTTVGERERETDRNPENQKIYEIPEEVRRKTAENSLLQSAQILIHMDEEWVIPEDPLQVGDTKEKMIECLGEPDELQESEEYPDGEEALYLGEDGRPLVRIILDNGMITGVRAK